MRRFFTLLLTGMALMGVAAPAMADWHGDRDHGGRGGWHDNGRHDNGRHRGWYPRERIVYRPVPVVRYWGPGYYDPYFYSTPYSTSFSFIFR